MFNEELFDTIYKVALNEMIENFNDVEVFLKLKAMFGEEKARWFLDIWSKI